MGEQTVTCPKCGNEIKLTESLAAPLVANVRAEYEKMLWTQRAAMKTREDKLSARAAEVDKAQADLQAKVQEQVTAQLAAERKTVAAAEAVKARTLVQHELAQRAEELKDRDARLQTLEEKLKGAQAAEAMLIKKERQLDDARRELDLNVERGVQTGLEEARTIARRQTEAEMDLKMKDSEYKITALKKQIDDLQRKAEQGSQQTQGEVLELALEGQLRARFPLDVIEPVAKGEFGGDVLQHVRDSSGQPCGSILWESKRTSKWQDGWLQKLRGDQRAAGAELAVIVSQSLPKDVTHFDHQDGIWVSSLSCTVPVAVALRQALVQLAHVRRAGEGQETKVQQVYAYLTGPRFRHRIESIVEKFSDMQDDLEKERKMMTKQWAKREEQIRCVVDATAGMYGDLQGIAGRSLQEIDALESKMLLSDEV